MPSQYEQIATAWLNNTKAPKNSRMFHQEDTLYSYGYHYAIARIIRDKNLVLFNCTKNSATTNRHKGIVRQVIRGGSDLSMQILEVPYPPKTLESNLCQLRDDLQRAIQTASKHMIKSNMIAVDHAEQRFDAIRQYLYNAMKNIDDVFAECHKDDPNVQALRALRTAYNTKRSK